MTQETSKRIAELNDAFRQSGKVVLTRGVLHETDAAVVLALVQQFNDFTEDNDPYGEHDFGTVCHGRVMWKIDYYDETMERWCDPLSPKCNRVLTIMLTSEY